MCYIRAFCRGNSGCGLLEEDQFSSMFYWEYSSVWLYYNTRIPILNSNYISMAPNASW